MHCRSFILFLQILVGVLAPLLFLAHTEWAKARPAPPEWEDAAATSPADAGGWARLRRRVWRAATAANWAVWHCACLTKRLSPPVCLWIMLCLTWSLSIALHGM